MSILGRADEIAFLNSIYESNRPELLAVYGRRRVGKTYLIQHQFKEKGIYFELTGIYNASLQQQLQNFSFAYAEAFAEGEVSNAPGNWLSAFNELWKKIQAASTAERIILFFDELPWLASPKSNFLNSLEHFWNRYVSNDQRVIMIVCGSAASWMIKHVINNRGGLHGRLTRKLKLLPYNLAQTEHYLQKNKIELTRKQIVELYMVTGGIPKYLSLVERGKSIPQIINDLCFSSNSFLAKEFENIYNSLFKHAENHIKIVRELAKRPRGMDQDELLKAVKLTSGGTSSKILKELAEAGFILAIPNFSKGKKNRKYKLIDFYSLFYLAWIEKANQQSIGEIESNYWQKLEFTPAWKSWSGYAFENVCLQHIPQIKSALGIAGVNSKNSAWWNTDSQIDLVIDRADQCINLCEIRFHNQEYQVSKEDVIKLQSRKYHFIEVTGSKKAIFITFISVYGAKKSLNYNTAIDNQVTVDDLFNEGSFLRVS